MNKNDEFNYSQELQSPYRYRGYDEENKKYVYGYYTRLIDGIRLYDSIVSKNLENGWGFRWYYIHHRESINMFTGLYDINGIALFQGDIVSFTDHSGILYKCEISRYKIGCGGLGDLEMCLYELFKGKDNKEDGKYLNVKFIKNHLNNLIPYNYTDDTITTKLYGGSL